MPSKSPVVNRDFEFKLKKLDETGTFEGWLSVFGELDDGGDVVEPGAFTKTLKEAGGQFPLLWQHDYKLPIGTFQAEQKDEGLWIKGQLLVDEIRQAKEAYALMKARIVKGLSIGFQSMRDKVEDGVRRLLEVKLREGSIVTFPMLSSAQIVSIKADFQSSLERREASTVPAAMIDALWGTLDSVLWSEKMNSEESLTASTEAIDQFRTAYLSRLPRLLEVIESSPQEFEEKAHQLELARAVRAVERIASRFPSNAADTLAPAAGTEDSAAGTGTKAVDTLDEERTAAADVLNRLAAKLKPA